MTDAPEKIWVQPDLGMVGTDRWVTQGTENPFGNIPYTRSDLCVPLKEAEALRAENARLREALEQIKKSTYNPLNTYKKITSTVSAIARAALEQKEGEDG